PLVPVYPAISQALQLAIGDVVAGAQTPAAALDRAFGTARAEFARQTTARRARSSGSDALAWMPAILIIAAAAMALWRLARDDRELACWVLPAAALVATLLLYPMLELVSLAFSETG